ncbi:hypothetical protein FQR65_LT11207 [Abscondita terminalis]|nr:hypothetical protein FQR65_LT11207 [Abscondita terminalis]
MLTTYLNNLPLSKFVLIEDCVQQPSTLLLSSLIDSHGKIGAVSYFTFEGVYKPISNATRTYNCVSNCNGWLPSPPTDFVHHLDSIDAKSTIIVIDSLAHAVMHHGFTTMYTTIKNLMSNEGVLRVIAVFHSDLIQDDNVLRYFNHLATMHLTLQPAQRITYTYKKTKKVITQTESYAIESGVLKCEKIKPAPVKTVLETLNPEQLSTFRIGLNDDEKENRSQVPLPYLPKRNLLRVRSRRRLGRRRSRRRSRHLMSIHVYNQDDVNKKILEVLPPTHGSQSQLGLSNGYREDEYNVYLSKRREFYEVVARYKDANRAALTNNKNRLDRETFRSGDCDDMSSSGLVLRKRTLRLAHDNNNDKIEDYITEPWFVRYLRLSKFIEAARTVILKNRLLRNLKILSTLNKDNIERYQRCRIDNISYPELFKLYID